MDAIRENDIHMVAVTNGHHFEPGSGSPCWVEARGRPHLTDYGSCYDRYRRPPYDMQPLNGLPLVHVSTPRITGLSAFFSAPWTSLLRAWV